MFSKSNGRWKCDRKDTELMSAFVSFCSSDCVKSFSELLIALFQLINKEPMDALLQQITVTVKV